MLTQPQIRGILVLLLSILAGPGPSPAVGQDIARDELRERRQEQRLLVREAQAGKVDGNEAASFALLVIPVDFADARLPEDWDPARDLQPLLTDPAGPGLKHYYDVASAGRLALEITLAPPVHLAGRRQDYSDIGWNGFSRTRQLARESLLATVAAGVELRRLDLLGSDGQVDGILILHAAVGQENDTEGGLIQPLQFFLEDPVEADGVQASFYAVASLRSGLGIWAHETGHLLGMEDRYDPLLHPEAGGVDVRSLGGLGRFSLMSSGAWGNGAGQGPALPDAYNCWRLGWLEPVDAPQSAAQDIEVRPWREGGSVYRIWTAGQPGEEYFLLECRDPAATAPYDAGIPAAQLMVTHVDETVPEAWYRTDGTDSYHLRVRLVEADADDQLREGLDDGTAADLFPGPLGIDALTPSSEPDSDGYSGPSGVVLENIRSLGGGVQLTVTATEGPALQVTGGVAEEAGENRLEIEVLSRGTAITELTATVQVLGDGGGRFPGGATAEVFSFTREDHTWRPAEPIRVLPPATIQPGVETLLAIAFQADGRSVSGPVFTFQWETTAGFLDIHLPGWHLWEEEFPAGVTTTRWRHWTDPPYLTADGSAVLACVGEAFDTPAQWPAVRYANSSRAVLVSPHLPGDTRLLRMTHAVEVEYLHPGLMMDGASVWWQGPDGQLVPAEPLEGHDAIISPRSSNPLAGRPALGDSLLFLDVADRPSWRVDSFPLPVEGGPWRLRLDFSSNNLWAGRGWFIARLEALAADASGGFQACWDPAGSSGRAGLRWTRPHDSAQYADYRLEVFDPVGRDFETLSGVSLRAEAGEESWYVLASDLLAALPRDSNRRMGLRIVGQREAGPLVSRTVFLYPDGGPEPVVLLEEPFPNPSRGQVKFLVDWPATAEGTLRIHDLRGRRVRSWDLQGGRRQMVWDGRDEQGRPLAAGTYFLRLDGSGLTETRKVVLLH